MATTQHVHNTSQFGFPSQRPPHVAGAALQMLAGAAAAAPGGSRTCNGAVECKIGMGDLILQPYFTKSCFPYLLGNFFLTGGSAEIK